MRIIRLHASLLSMSARRQLTYRTNLLFEAVLTLATVAASLASVLALHTQSRTLGGFTPDATVMMVGTFHIVTGLRRAFVEPNLRFNANSVASGEFDAQLLQPAPILFLVTLGSASPLALTQTLLGVGVVATVARHVPTTPGQAGAYVVLVLLATVIMWATRSILATSVFFSLGLTLDVVYDAVWQTGPYPTTLFPRATRWALTIIPMAFLAYVPTAVYAGQLPITWLAVAAGATTVAVLVTIATWRAALSRYASATS